MKSKSIQLILFISIFTLSCNHHEKEVKQKKTASIHSSNSLFIGNSYTYRNGGIDYHLSQIIKADSTGFNCYITRAAKGKYHLYSHWEDQTTLTIFKQKKWDNVLLQEYSSGPIRDSLEFFKNGKLWAEKIKKANPQTQIYLFATWGYKGTKTMVDSLNMQYQKLAKMIGAKTVPVGLLWKSLKDKINLYDKDGAHPNRMGTFLNACLFYEYMYNKDITKTAYFDNLIDREIQLQLKKWAHDFHLKQG